MREAGITFGNALVWIAGVGCDRNYNTFHSC